MDRDLLRSTSLRQAMISFALRRGAGADAEDAVQTTLAEAWQNTERPEEPEQLRRWLWGILRHKVVDVQRKRAREIVAGDLESPTSGPPLVHARTTDDPANDLLRWASRSLPEGKDTEQTLEWLLREAEGESLDHIAKEAALPPARVRKRVSRLREHFRAHWQRDVAALAALGIVLALCVRFWPKEPPTEPIARDPQPVQDPRPQRALELRDQAHQACENGAWQRCLDLLDEAQGTGQPELERAASDRTRAKKALEPAPVPSSTPTPPRTKSTETSTPLAPKPQRKSGTTSDIPGGGSL